MYDHLLGWLLGMLGGAGPIAGTAGLFWTKLAADQEPQARHLLGADAGLPLLLLMIGMTGELLLAVRATGAMGVALTVRLGFVLAFIVTMPYSKFVHGLYRTGTLIRHAIERPGANDPKPHVVAAATPAR